MSVFAYPKLAMWAPPSQPSADPGNNKFDAWLILSEVSARSEIKTLPWGRPANPQKNTPFSESAQALIISARSGCGPPSNAS